uniref:Putative ubiquitin-like-specific protease 2A isoform X2 n=1 Tax=Rhizophora mucronata TaxID=61149 RepID=A0A2P2M0A4_RHIMU
MCAHLKFHKVSAYTGTLEKESRNDPVNADDELIDVCSEEGTDTPSWGICNPPVDIDINGVGDCHQYCVTCPVSTPQEENAVKDEISGVDTLVLSSSSICETEQVGVISDEEDWIETNSSSPVSALAKKEVSLEEHIAGSGSVGHEIDFVNKAVIVFPDFILFGDLYCTESRLTFSRCCIKVEGSTVNGEKGTFNAEWPVGDIVDFESEWCGVVSYPILSSCHSILLAVTYLIVWVIKYLSITGCRLRLLLLTFILNQRFLMERNMQKKIQVCAFYIITVGSILFGLS